MFQVLHLPSWFPGMSFKKEMAVARELSKQYVNRPFEYALQTAVMVTLLISYGC
jgi:type III secretory pathway component EscU